MFKPSNERHAAMGMKPLEFDVGDADAQRFDVAAPLLPTLSKKTEHDRASLNYLCRSH